MRRRQFYFKLENVAIVKRCNLRTPYATSVRNPFNCDAMPSLKSLNPPVAVLWCFHWLSAQCVSNIGQIIKQEIPIPAGAHCEGLVGRLYRQVLWTVWHFSALLYSLNTGFFTLFPWRAQNTGSDKRAKLESREQYSHVLTETPCQRSCAFPKHGNDLRWWTVSAINRRWGNGAPLQFYYTSTTGYEAHDASKK